MRVLVPADLRTSTALRTVNTGAVTAHKPDARYLDEGEGAHRHAAPKRGEMAEVSRSIANATVVIPAVYHG